MPTFSFVENFERLYKIVVDTLNDPQSRFLFIFKSPDETKLKLTEQWGNVLLVVHTAASIVSAHSSNRDQGSWILFRQWKEGGKDFHGRKVEKTSIYHLVNTYNIFFNKKHKQATFKFDVNK